MTADAPEPGSVVAAAAAVLVQHGTRAGRDRTGADGRDYIQVLCQCGDWEDDFEAHQAEQLAAAGLLAAAAPAADADEVLRQRLMRIFDLENAGDDPWRLDLMCAALSAHRAREVADAEARGRRAGLAEAVARLRRLVDVEEAGDDHTGMIRAAELLDEQAAP